MSFSVVRLLSVAMVAALVACTVTIDGPGPSGDTQSGDPGPPGDTQSGDPAPPGDTQSGDPVTPGDTQSGDPVTSGDTQSGDPVTPGDTRSGDSVTPGDTQSGDSNAGDPLVVPVFVKDPIDAAVVTSGHPGVPIFAADPMVLADAEGYHLFHTNIFCGTSTGYYFAWDPADPPLACSIVDNIGTIAYAFSDDAGLTWTYRTTPIVFPTPESFDARKIETAFVTRVQDTLYLFYSSDGVYDSMDFDSRYQIGVATLDLGTSTVREALLDEGQIFTTRPTPVLPFDLGVGRFDNNTQEPSVIWRNNQFELWYIGIGWHLPLLPNGAPGQGIHTIGLGRAVIDTELNVVSRSDQPILGGSLAEGSLDQVPNITEMHLIDDTYHLFSTTLVVGGEFHEDEEINYFWSKDGIAWSPASIVLSPGPAAFDNWGMMAPTVVVESDRLVMIYTAYETEDRVCFPVPPTGRFGMPVAGDTKCLYAQVGRAVAPR